MINNIKPIYKEFKGWKQDMTQCKSESGFPKEFSDYVAFIEHYLGVRIGIISLGPDRTQTIIR